MPENKRDDDEVSPGKSGAAGSDLDKAMADAMRSVEARERKSSSPSGGAEDEAEDGGEAGRDAQANRQESKSAATAVTESLLKAKKELEEVLAQTQNEAKSLRDKWLRSAADLENYKKRAVKEREDVQKFGNERMLRDFLPVIDDLDRVVGSAKSTDAQSQAVIDGVKLVLKKFLDQLEKHGVTSFQAEGQPFDPNQHEAVQQVHADTPAGTVVSQLQRGYLLGGRLLRPALVTVSLGPAAGSGDGTKKETQG